MSFVRSLAFASILLLPLGVTARAADFPTSSIKVVVPYAPGGNGDFVARALGKKVSSELGQAIIVDNRSGGDGVVGTQFVARAKPDGYTMLQMATANVILPLLRTDLQYKIDSDFKPVFGITQVPLVFAVLDSSPAHSIADLATLAKSTSGGLNYGSGGAGSISHLAAARLVGDLKVTGTHIPLRGFSAAVQALLGEQVQFICVTTADIASLVQSHQIRVLAVASDHRVKTFPDAPTMEELGYKDFVAASWNAYLVPAGTPDAIVASLSQAYQGAANDPEVQKEFASAGVELQPMSPDALAKFIRDDASRWHQVVEDNHIELQSGN